jgi:hypothetical protein
MDARSCERMLVPLGLHRHCRGFGSLQWTEVWCGAPRVQATASAAPAAPSPPATASNRGASNHGPQVQAERGAGGVSDALLLALPAGVLCTFALVAALQRRRRTVASRLNMESPPTSSRSSEHPHSDS